MRLRELVAECRQAFSELFRYGGGLHICKEDQGTQQNAAMVEETTAAAHSLAREAEQLFELLGQFDVGAASARAGGSVQPLRSATASPVRRMTTKIVRAFDGNTALKGDDQWEEF